MDKGEARRGVPCKIIERLIRGQMDNGRQIARAEHIGNGGRNLLRAGENTYLRRRSTRAIREVIRQIIAQRRNAIGRRLWYIPLSARANGAEDVFARAHFLARHNS
jgi:hypothetical protein